MRDVTRGARRPPEALYLGGVGQSPELTTTEFCCRHWCCLHGFSNLLALRLKLGVDTSFTKKVSCCVVTKPRRKLTFMQLFDVFIHYKGCLNSMNCMTVFVLCTYCLHQCIGYSYFLFLPTLLPPTQVMACAHRGEAHF